MAPISSTEEDGRKNNKDVTGAPKIENEKKEGTDTKESVTVTGKGLESQSETVPGWTIMRPLRMGRLKGKGAPTASTREVKNGGSSDGNDLKGAQTNDATGAGEVEALSNVRSLDGLLEGDTPDRRSGDAARGHNAGRDYEGEEPLGGQEFKVYKRRWFGVAQLVLLNIVVSWDWLTFSANSTTASTYYNVSPTAINWLSTGFLFAFVVVSPIVLLTLHRGGPKPSIMTASVLLLVGNWIRYGATRAGKNGSFGGVMFGQILTGFAQPFVLAAPTRYSDLWFSNRGRVAATALMSMANPLGGAVAQLVGPELATTSGDIPFLVLIVSIVATVAAIPSFFIPAQPPTPVAASSSTPKQDILPSLRYLFALPEFYMVALPFAFYVGLFNSLSSLINQFLQPYSFSETQAGIAGALLIVVGLVATGISSPIIDKTKSFLLAIKIATPLIGLSYLAFTFTPASRNELGPYIVLAVLGAASFSLMPVALEFVIEITHPVSPEVTSTICWTGGQILGGIFIIISGELRAAGKSDGTEDDGSSRPPANMYNALVFQAVIAMFIAPVPLFLGLFGRKEHVKMRRVEADRLAAQRRIDHGF